LLQIRTMDTNIKATFEEMEGLAEDVAADKQLLLNIDRNRQRNREAIRALNELPTSKDNVWLLLGPVFVKKSVKDVQSRIAEEQSRLESESAKARERMKTAAQTLHELEGRAADMKGFNLKPLSKND